MLREHPEQDHAFYETLAPQDNVERFYAYQKLSHAPFFLLTEQPKAVLDQSWRRLADPNSGFLSLGALIAFAMIAPACIVSAFVPERGQELLEKAVAGPTKGVSRRRTATSS